MPEWWSYSLSDFLLFSPRTYYRMIERYNAALWPAHILTLVSGIAILGLLHWRPRWLGRAISAILALLWAWVGWSFLRERYSTINWAASYFVWIFAAEAFLLLGIGVARDGLGFGLRRDAAGAIGLVLFSLGLLLYPALAPALRRGWEGSEVFGVMPDPTSIATLGLVLLARGRPRWELLAGPALWCLFSGATLWAMRAPEWWVPPLAAALALGASAWRRLSP